MKLKKGKIDHKLLAELLAGKNYSGGRAIIGSSIGEDAAVIDMGDKYLLAKTDPITHAGNRIGHYAVHVNANDIAAMGGTPLWFLATVLMPAESSGDDLKLIFDQLADACNSLNIAWCGGHTEVTSAVVNPVVIGQMLGEAEKHELKPSRGALAGDLIFITKTTAIEGTAIMALEGSDKFRSNIDAELLEKASGYLDDPGISVLKEASLIKSIEEVHALHDPTEGGVTTGIWELAIASNLGVRVYEKDIPITEETKALARSFGINPLGTFASGSLLIAVSKAGSEKVIARLNAENIAVTCIGEMTPKDRGMILVTDKGESQLPIFSQDELSRIFG